jgi:hypothetical protein
VGAVVKVGPTATQANHVLTVKLAVVANR